MIQGDHVFYRRPFVPTALIWVVTACLHAQGHPAPEDRCEAAIRVITSRSRAMADRDVGRSLEVCEGKVAGAAMTTALRASRQEQDQHAPDLEVHGNAPELEIGTASEEDHDKDGNEKDPQQRQ